MKTTKTSNRRQLSNRNRLMKAESLESRRLLAGDAPTFELLGDQTVEVGSPLHLPIDGFDADGGPLTVSVEVSNPEAVTAEVITGNRSLRLDVASFGTMIFELYEGRAPRPTARIIELTEAGFYDGIIFHRIVDDFVLQAGDPNGTGQTGSDLGTFDDQFHPDLQHNQNGVLSFAKTSADDTNNSQFFITERETVNTRNLDFNHSVFGQLVEGEDVRETLSEVPVEVPPTGQQPTNRPITDVVIESATIFEDIENSIVMLRAIGAGGQSDVTITIADAEGNSSFETFTVNTIGDQFNAGPYLVDPGPVILAPAGQSFSLPLTAIDIEEEPFQFVGLIFTENFGTANINTATQILEPVNDELQLELDEGFVGDIDLIIGVRSFSGNPNHIDTQGFTIEVVDSLTAPTSIDLASSSDSGSSNDDNITNANRLVFDVSDVTAGADVEIVRADTGDVLGLTRASDESVSVDVDLPDEFLDGTLELIARQRVGDVISDATNSLSVEIDRSSPQFLGSPIPEHLFAGDVLSEVLTSNESDVDWSLISGPVGLTVELATGQVNWPTTADTRDLHPFAIRIADRAGNEAEQSYSINVTSRYFNPIDAFDVNGSGEVDSLDALIVINAISRNGGEIELPETDGSEPSPLNQDFFYNTNNDTAITALDALVVMNEIARRQAGGGPSLDAESIITFDSSSPIHGLGESDDERDEHRMLF
ncbi:peptidylprolyl isomerase [Rubripirellula obstinata]|uniref:peptidylprolyl isomerase n=1 Tax=Rubripirellula obstinata TaxID=406547 RepID=UPI00138FB90F|nr:peptidylprolyl isomerase [Rubripirellula obstinata]